MPLPTTHTKRTTPIGRGSAQHSTIPAPHTVPAAPGGLGQTSPTQLSVAHKLPSVILPKLGDQWAYTADLRADQTPPQAMRGHPLVPKLDFTRLRSRSSGADGIHMHGNKERIVFHLVELKPITPDRKPPVQPISRSPDAVLGSEQSPLTCLLPVWPVFSGHANSPQRQSRSSTPEVQVLRPQRGMNELPIRVGRITLGRTNDVPKKTAAHRARVRPGAGL